VTAIITGCFQLSFFVFFVFDQLWYFGHLDYRTIFIAHSVVCLFCLAASVALWPDKPFQFDEEVGGRTRPHAAAGVGSTLVIVFLGGTRFWAKELSERERKRG
jgi:hypothetical protein